MDCDDLPEPTSRGQHIINTQDAAPYIEEIRACLGWIPTEVAKKTLDATTQLVKNTLQIPLKRHIKSRKPHQNHPRLRKLYCTDTIFSGMPPLVDIDVPKSLWDDLHILLRLIQ